MAIAKHDVRKGPASAKKSSRTSEPRRSATPSDKILSDDSEAETIIGGSKHNTPLKARQLESDDGASQYTNGDDRTSPDAVVDDPPPSTRKRKAASSSDGGRTADGASTKARLVSKRVRLTQDEDAAPPAAAAHDKAAVKIKSEDGDDTAGATNDKHDLTTTVATAATKDDDGDTGSRAAKPESSQSPKVASRKSSHDYSSASNRASTHEPRTRSQSPSHSSHKRSTSLQSGGAGNAPADHERRLRSRRGATETAIPLNPSRLNSAPTPANPPTPLSATMPRAKDQDRSGRTALFRACEEGDPAKVRSMFPEAKNDIERPDNAQNKPLQAAALLGRTAVVEILLEAGCEVNCFNDAGDTALIDAIDNGHIDVVALLLKFGADPWQKNNEYEMPRDRLDMMDDGPERDAITKLLADATIDRYGREPADPYVEPARDRTRPGLRKDRIYSDVNIDMMRKAFLYNDNDTISDLLRHSGVVPDNSCAVAAAKGGHVRPLEKLVVLDPNPNDVDQTPMLEAIGRGNLEVVKFLLNSEGFNPCRIIDGKAYYQIAREHKGPRSREEVSALKRAYRTYRESKSTSQQDEIPAPSENEDDEEELPDAPNNASGSAKLTATPTAKLTNSVREMQVTEDSSAMEATKDTSKSLGKQKEVEEKDSSDESIVQSPRTASKRRRLVSGSERAKHRQKIVESSTSDESKHEKANGDAEQKLLAEEEQRKAQEAEEAEKARIAAEEEEKRKAAEEEERKRKEEEEEEQKRKAEEEERKRREEEEERRRLEEEEEARRKAEEEERRRLEEEERIRREQEEEEARLAAEAKRLAEEEARRAEEEERARQAAIQAAREAREAYLKSLPRGFRHALQEGWRLIQTRPAEAQYQHYRTLTDWKPIITVKGHELENCPEEMKEKMWMPNFFASMFLHHDRLDECSQRLGWPMLRMTPEQRTRLTENAQLVKSLNLEQNWIDATPAVIAAECSDVVGVYYDRRGRANKTVTYTKFNQDARAAFYDLPEDQLYWIPLEIFMQATKECKWLEGHEIFTRTGVHVGPKGSYSEHQPPPAPKYKNGEVVEENIAIWQLR